MSLRAKRAARYRDWDSLTPSQRIVSGVVTVYTSDLSEHGYSDRLGKPYKGEAGYSDRLWVHWRDGRTTLCSLAAMFPFQEEPCLPGGFVEWKIR